MNVSVIIPMYNSRRTALQTLQGLSAQNRSDFEVIVVDDGSTDDSAQLVEEFSRSSSFPLRIIRQPNAGPAAARNNGALQAKGSFLVFLDSDCVPPPGWLNEMVSLVKDGVVGSHCGYHVKNSASLVARYIDLEIAHRHRELAGHDIDSVASYSACVSKEAFVAAGAFNKEYTAANAEDFDLSFQMRKRGGRLVFTDKTFVYHYHPESLRRYLRQQYTRGYWRVKMYLRNRDKIVQGDSYTGHEAQVQFILSNAALVSLPLGAVHYAIPAAAIVVLLLSNLPLGLWAARREAKFIVVAPVFASMRSLAGTFGAYGYVLSSIARPFKRAVQTT